MENESEDVELDFSELTALNGEEGGLCLASGLLDELEDDGKAGGGGSRTVPTTPYGAGKTFQYIAPLATSPEETIDFAGFRRALEQRVGARHANPIPTPPQPAQLAVPFITCSLNGISIIQLTLPSVEHTAASVTSIVKPMSMANPRKMPEGKYFLQTVVVLPSIFLSSKLSWVVVLKLANSNSEKLIDIGTISKENSDVFLETELDFEPETAILTATHNAVIGQKKLDPEVESFIDEIKDIFYSATVNPRGGSLQLSTVSDHIKTNCSTQYHKLVEIGYKGDFQAMILDHPDTFLVFQFSDKEIESRGLDQGSAKEVRVALTLHEKQGCKAVNTQKESNQRETEKQLISKLEEILHDRDYDQRELLDIVARDPKLLFFLSPSFSTLMRFLSKHRDIFAWTTHPDKPTSIGLVGMLKAETKPIRERVEKEKEKEKEKEDQPLQQTSGKKKKKKKNKANSNNVPVVTTAHPVPAPVEPSSSAEVLDSVPKLPPHPTTSIVKQVPLPTQQQKVVQQVQQPQHPVHQMQQAVNMQQLQQEAAKQQQQQQQVHLQQNAMGLQVAQTAAANVQAGVQQISYQPQLQQQQIVLTTTGAYQQAGPYQQYSQQQYPVHYDVGSGTTIAYPYSEIRTLPLSPTVQPTTCLPQQAGIQNYVMTSSPPSILSPNCQFRTVQQLPTGILQGMNGIGQSSPANQG
eukprot:TRINITY_DN2860_c0_g1_i1.p1 TRINITY_DN2860_c0_g1~~TRINITY_DN2860_c0_g1_i1.p1  ORF type:complete len:715 (+),score=109.73 TRINITY_DN2860_c0_g1_i1:70-2145(+)